MEGESNEKRKNRKSRKIREWRDPVVEDTPRDDLFLYGPVFMAFRPSNNKEAVKSQDADVESVAFKKGEVI